MEVPEDQNGYSIIFESVTRVGIGEANLAIDDLSIRKGTCRKHPGGKLLFKKKLKFKKI